MNIQSSIPRGSPIVPLNHAASIQIHDFFPIVACHSCLKNRPSELASSLSTLVSRSNRRTQKDPGVRTTMVRSCRPILRQGGNRGPAFRMATRTQEDDLKQVKTPKSYYSIFLTWLDNPTLPPTRHPDQKR